MRAGLADDDGDEILLVLASGKRGRLRRAARAQRRSHQASGRVGEIEQPPEGVRSVVGSTSMRARAVASRPWVSRTRSLWTVWPGVAYATSKLMASSASS